MDKLDLLKYMFYYYSKEVPEKEVEKIEKIFQEIQGLIEKGEHNAEMIMKLDKELRTRAINYKKFGHDEVLENTRSLYRKIFGREI